MKKIRSLVAVCLVAIFLGSVIQPLLVLSKESNENSKVKAEDFEIIYDNETYQFNFPLDLMMMRTAEVKNTGTTDLEFCFNASVTGPGLYDSILPVFPQGPFFYLEPNETQIIWIPAKWGYINWSYWEDGGSYNYTMQINVWPKEWIWGQENPSLPKPKTVNLTNTVHVILSTSLIENNSYVHGYVYDNLTKMPLSNIEINLNSQGDVLKYKNTTNETGFFNISCHAYKYRFENIYMKYCIGIIAQGYEEFYKAVVPEENSDVYVNIYLNHAPNITGNYRLIAKQKVDINTAIVDASEDGKYFAVMPFHSAVSLDFINEHANLSFFDINGSLLWKYHTHYESPCVDVSDDGSYVAVPITPSEASQEEIELYQGTHLINARNCSLIWKYSFAVPGAIPNPTACRISHNNKYIVIGDGNGNVCLLNLTTKELIWNTTGRPCGAIRFLRFSKNDSYIYAGAGDGYFYCFDTMTGAVIWRTYVTAWTFSAAFTPDGSHILVNTKLAYTTLLDKNGNLIWQQPAGLCWCCVTQNASLAVTSTHADPGMGTVIIDKQGNILYWWSESGIGPRGGAISQDEKYILTCNHEPSPGIIKLTTIKGHTIWSYPLEDHPHYAIGDRSFVYISENCSKFVVGGLDGNMYFFEGNITEIPEWLPTAVTLSEPTDITSNSLTLTWSQNLDEDFANYTIYQSTTFGVLGDPITFITTNTTTSWTVTDLSPGQTYYFTVRVYDTSRLYNDSIQVNATTLSVQVVKTIGPSGGNITLEKLTLIIPPNALSENVSFNITTVSVTLSEGYGIVGSVYNIECAVTTFAEAITITLSYAGITLPENVSENDLAIYKRTDNTWNKLGGTIDKINKTISIEITTLSEFAIFYKIPIEGEGKPSEIPWLYIIISVIIIIVVLVGAVLGIKRRKKASPPEKPAGK